ncbi:unnamed protein product [Cladocopium goreaui]|uniref:Palmitoyltransferase n=1 Tax=Cladocopium goreaui TaxID=2562237 RepID=A0A9P1BKT7_9DINO|nr:unnamed protein product [Cladocopium goreaui]
MAPSIARQAWLFCCNTVCSERVLSPILVLLVHGLLVADVTYHRQELWQEISLWYCSVRLLVVATIALYIGTSCTNPGFVESSESQSGTSSCTCCFLLCCGLCMRKGGSMGKVSHLSTDSTGGEPSTNLAPDEPLDSLDPESGVQMTVIDEGIQKRRGTMEIDADEEGVELRWCKRCQLQQPLRSKHCHDCGRCVRTHDHHCPWVGSCVGENNRVLFFWYLILQSIELGVFFKEGILGISLLKPSVVLMVGLLFIAIFFLMVSCLLSFHGFLILANLTTWEHISWRHITYLKSLRAERGSPFARSLWWNVAVYCCGALWCPSILRRFPNVRYDNGGVLWDLSEQRGMCCLIACCAETC